MSKFSTDTKIIDKVGDFKTTKRFNNKIGFINGYLEVKELAGRNKHSQAIWRCLCNACGRDDVYVASGDLKRNISCGCARNNTNKLSVHPNHQLGSKSLYWKGYEEISGYKFSKIKQSAVTRNIDFNITIQQIWDLYIKQNKCCALSGVVIEFGTKGNELGTASLDRIDSKKGYTIDNVQWVHKCVNTMKMNLEEKYFIELCCKIANKKGAQND